MTRPVLYGAPYSVYVRIARLAFHEKGVAYRLEPVDIFGAPPEEYERLHPFAKIPALRHDDFLLYETDAIVRYVEEGFEGPALAPRHPRERARMTQLMRILDNYGYPALVWGIFVREAGAEGDRDAGKLAAAIAPADRCLEVLEGFLAEALGGSAFFGGERPSLADLHAAPMLTYLAVAPTGRQLLERRPLLSAWLSRMSRRDSLAATRFPAEDRV